MVAARQQPLDAVAAPEGASPLEIAFLDAEDEVAGAPQEFGGANRQLPPTSASSSDVARLRNSISIAFTLARCGEIACLFRFGSRIDAAWPPICEPAHTCRQRADLSSTGAECRLPPRSEPGAGQRGGTFRLVSAASFGNRKGQYGLESRVGQFAMTGAVISPRVLDPLHPRQRFEALSSAEVSESRDALELAKLSAERDKIKLELTQLPESALSPDEQRARKEWDKEKSTLELTKLRRDDANEQQEKILELQKLHDEAKNARLSPYFEFCKAVVPAIAIAGTIYAALR